MDVLLVLFGLIALAIPFLLPVISLVSGYRTRQRVAVLEAALEEQKAATGGLTAILLELKRDLRSGVPQEGPAAAPAPWSPAAFSAASSTVSASRRTGSDRSRQTRICRSSRKRPACSTASS